MTGQLVHVVFGHQRFGAQIFGGVTRYFVELASALNSLDSVNAEVFSPLYLSEFLDPALLARPGGHRVRSFPGARPIVAAANLGLAKCLLRHRVDIDVYHATYYSRFNVAPRRSAHIITVFDMIHELFPTEFPALDRTRQVKAKSIRQADHIICISRSTQSDLVRILGIPESRTSVVHLASSLTVRKPGGSPVGRPYLLYVGQRSGYKNFLGMLRAYAASASLSNSFRILCFGGGALTASERDDCARLGIAEGSVQHMSGGDDALVTAYANATMLVYPSLYEGFGLPPLEAMSLGCPVVCSSTSSLPEVVGEASEYFDPMSVDSMRYAMEHVADSPTRQAELRLLGARRSEAFSWRNCAEQTLEAYQRVTKGAHAPSIRQ